MPPSHPPEPVGRRWILRAGLAVPLAGVLAACRDDGGESRPRAGAAGRTTPAPGPVTSLTPTPACGDDTELTADNAEGPFFSPGSPERASLLEAGVSGEPLVVRGAVLSTACAPVAGALLDFWQTDGTGEYDNDGFRMRGHQFTDAGGGYELETVLPGLYPGRTRHIHVKAQAPNGPVLTTQLYFPDEERNDGDSLFRPELVMTVLEGRDGRGATFDFVLET